MKLRKNDLQLLRKGGVIAIDSKLVELAADMLKNMTLNMKKELKNPRELSLTRRAIAKLKTIRSEVKGDK